MAAVAVAIAELLTLKMKWMMKKVKRRIIFRKFLKRFDDWRCRYILTQLTVQTDNKEPASKSNRLKVPGNKALRQGNVAG
jgi:hypothetical protein